MVNEKNNEKKRERECDSVIMWAGTKSKEQKVERSREQ